MAEVLTAPRYEASTAHHLSPRSLSPDPSAVFLERYSYPRTDGVLDLAPPPPPSSSLSSSADCRQAHPDMYSTRSSSSLSSPRQSSTSLSRSSSFHSTAPSSVESYAYHADMDRIREEEQADEVDFLPSYGYSAFDAKHHPLGPGDESTPDFASSTTTDDDEVPRSPAFPHVADDTEVREEPSRQVDYLSHNWREEDIWSSWKHIVSRRKEYGERSRLENASWRTWAKSKYKLQTVSPERLNWLKDCDVTWLYGPLQHGRSGHGRHDSSASGAASGLGQSKNNSFLHKKSNLKKRSVSEVMLQKSLSSSSLIKQAAAAVEAQRRSGSSSSNSSNKNNDARPSLERGRSDYGPATSTQHKRRAQSDYSTVLTSSCSSEIHSPEAHSRRHIRFDTKVEQCIAVEFKETSTDGGLSSDPSEHALSSPSSSSEDDLPMLKMRSRGIIPRQTSQTSSSRNSFSGGENNGIAKLPSTSIRFHADEAEEQQQQQASLFGLGSGWRISASAPPGLDKSPSQETLRPAKASANFVIDDEDGDCMIDWTPSDRSTTRRAESPASSKSSTETLQAGLAQPTTAAAPAQDDRREGLRRSPSGTLSLFDDGADDGEIANEAGMFGRVLDTVNTARDIAHVIWNVGWRK